MSRYEIDAIGCHRTCAEVAWSTHLLANSSLLAGFGILTHHGNTYVCTYIHVCTHSQIGEDAWGWQNPCLARPALLRSTDRNKEGSQKSPPRPRAAVASAARGLRALTTTLAQVPLSECAFEKDPSDFVMAAAQVMSCSWEADGSQMKQARIRGSISGSSAECDGIRKGPD